MTTKHPIHYNVAAQRRRATDVGIGIETSMYQAIDPNYVPRSELTNQAAKIIECENEQAITIARLIVGLQMHDTILVQMLQKLKKAK